MDRYRHINVAAGRLSEGIDVSKDKKAAAKDKLDAVGIDEICRRTAECVPQRTIAADIGVSWATLMLWLSRPGHAEQYARAREAQADKLAEDILAIADDGSNDTYTTEDGEQTNHDVIARSRLRVDARKWLASKMAPKRYGEKIVHASDPENPLVTQLVVSGSELAAKIKSANLRGDPEE